VEAALDDFDFRTALAAIWALVTRANGYVEENAPWVLARQERDGDAVAGQRLDTVLYTLVESLRLVSEHLAPLLPAAAAQIAAQLGAPHAEHPQPDRHRWGGLQPGTQVAPPHPLFPRIEPAGDTATDHDRRT
jgi:methionyl-tRNA synthetase